MIEKLRLKFRKSTEPNYQISGWQLIYTPTWCYDDPIYVRLSDSIKKNHNLEHAQLELTRDDIKGDGIYLLIVNGKYILTSLHHYCQGLDGSGYFYTFDLPNIK